MEHGYEFLAEKEEMWAKMLVEVLEDNRIPCITIPVYGVGLVIKTGKQECLRIYVPEQHLQVATDLYNMLFSGESILE